MRRRYGRSALARDDAAMIFQPAGRTPGRGRPAKSPISNWHLACPYGSGWVFVRASDASLAWASAPPWRVTGPYRGCLGPGNVSAISTRTHRIWGTVNVGPPQTDPFNIAVTSSAVYVT